MTEPERPTRVWLLIGAKPGDNAQLEAIAAALGAHRCLSIERRPLHFHRAELLVTLLQTPSLLGLVPAPRSGANTAIEPPWPDLVLTAGRRNEPVARWIQRRSRGRTRVVHVGRPWADPRRYDLVISTAQYFLDGWTPGRILRLDLPPVAPPSAAPATSTPDAGSTLQSGPATAAPWLPQDAASAGTAFMALLVGGESGSQTLPPPAAIAICTRALALARSRSLALRVSTSARTTPDAERALERLADTEPDLEVHGWHAAAAASATTNPYRDWLRTAAAFVVTGDSVSMVTDAVGTQRPVWIARLPRAKPWWQTLRGWRWRSVTHELGQRFAPRRFRRDVTRLLAALVRSGRAQWLEHAEAAPLTPDSVQRNTAATRSARPRPTPAVRAAQAVDDLLPGAPRTRENSASATASATGTESPRAAAGRLPAEHSAEG